MKLIEKKNEKLCKLHRTNNFFVYSNQTKENRFIFFACPFRPKILATKHNLQEAYNMKHNKTTKYFLSSRYNNYIASEGPHKKQPTETSSGFAWHIDTNQKISVKLAKIAAQLQINKARQELSMNTY